jgi:hypothetical protein
MSIRGVSIVMHEQLAAHWCPIQLSIPRIEDTADTPSPLVTTFLSSELPRPGQDKPMRYALHLRILSLEERNGLFGFGDHLEQVGDFDDILIVDMGWRDRRPAAWAEWNSKISGSLRHYEPAGEPLRDEESSPGTWVAHVPLPTTAQPILGEQAKVRLTVTARR